MKSSLKNMILVLVAITAVAAAGVGGVYSLTKEPIAKAKIAKTNAAIGEVMPEFNNNPSQDTTAVNINGTKMYVYTAKMNDAVVGYGVECFSNNGFGGLVKLLVGITPEGEITKISVLEHKETPGLGDKIDPAKSDFRVQFEGKNPENFKISVKKDGGDVDAITASTITSRAYCEAVNQAFNTFKGIAK